MTARVTSAPTAVCWCLRGVVKNGGVAGSGGGGGMIEPLMSVISFSYVAAFLDFISNMRMNY